MDKKRIIVMTAFVATVFCTEAQVKVANNNNVGIGTNIPEKKLHINGELLVNSYEVDWGRAIWTKVYNKSACSYNLWNAYYGKDVFYVCGDGYLWTMKGGYFGSDIALKKNIEPIYGALDLVKKLNGVKYQYNDIGVVSEKDSTDENSSNDEYRMGFIAQEVELIVPEVVKTMPDSTKAISYTDLIALLVEAIKEQQNIIENLQLEIASQKDALDVCCNKNQKSIQEFEFADPTDEEMEDMKIYQNAPNPFHKNTTIQCYIPQTIQKAELCVYNMQGVQLKCLTVLERGTTTIQIQAGQLAAGVYTYLLMGDGKTSDAKQMILTK